MKKISFIKHMKELVSLKKDEERVRKAFQKLNPDFNFFYLGRAETLIREILKGALNDESDWIGYWLYDLDCGKKYKHGCVTSKEGNNIPMKTLSDVWECIRKDNLK